MRMSASLAVLLLATLSFVGELRSAHSTPMTVTYEQTWSFTTVDSTLGNGAETGTNQALLPLFDETLGILTAVHIEVFELAFGGTLVSAICPDEVCRADALGSSSSGLVIGIAGALVASFGPVSLEMPTATCVTAAGESECNGAIGGLPGGIVDFLDFYGADIDQFIGIGNLLFDSMTSTELLFASFALNPDPIDNGTVSAQTEVLVNGEASVTYTYEAIAAPGSALLLALGLLVLGRARKLSR